MWKGFWKYTNHFITQFLCNNHIFYQSIRYYRANTSSRTWKFALTNIIEATTNNTRQNIDGYIYHCCISFLIYNHHNQPPHPCNGISKAQIMENFVGSPFSLLNNFFINFFSIVKFISCVSINRKYITFSQFCLVVLIAY